MNLTPDSLLATYNKLGTIPATAKKLGLTKSKVYYHLRHHPDYVSGNRKRWTTEAITGFLNRYKAGETLSAIARSEGVPLASLYYHLRSDGRYARIPRPPSTRDETWDKLETCVRLRKSGLSFEEIAERLDCSRQYASHLFQRHKDGDAPKTPQNRS